MFSSPSPGYYLSMLSVSKQSRARKRVFVPFSGVLLIYDIVIASKMRIAYSFRPLLGGVTYLYMNVMELTEGVIGFRPLLRGVTYLYF